MESEGRSERGWGLAASAWASRTADGSCRTGWGLTDETTTQQNTFTVVGSVLVVLEVRDPAGNADQDNLLVQVIATDGDGLSGWDEENVYLTDPDDADTDGAVPAGTARTNRPIERTRRSPSSRTPCRP